MFVCFIQGPKGEKGMKVSNHQNALYTVHFAIIGAQCSVQYNRVHCMERMEIINKSVNLGGSVCIISDDGPKWVSIYRS